MKCKFFFLFIMLIQLVHEMAVAQTTSQTTSQISTATAEEKTANLIRSDSYSDLLEINGRTKWLGASVQTDQVAGKFGAQITYGFLRKSSFGFDVRLSAGFVNYGSIRAAANDLDDRSTSNETDQNAELNRQRQDQDTWAYVIAEPGISISTRLWPRRFPLLTETARFSLGVGSFKDVANDVSFTSTYLVTFESALAYQLSHKSPWSWTLSMALTNGVLKSRPVANQSSSGEVRLPVNWFTIAAGLQYAL